VQFKKSKGKKTNYYSKIIPSIFGKIAIVWHNAEEGLKVCRVFLSDEHATAQDRLEASFPKSILSSSTSVNDLGEKIQSFLEGEDVLFDLDIVAIDKCSEFQQHVLLAGYKIPRGWISTYGKISRQLKIEGGSRAVGGALAKNPFPIIIPCHRAIRSNGELGGYQGGLKMKRTLLALEGVEISEKGKVTTSQVYY